MDRPPPTSLGIWSRRWRLVVAAACLVALVLGALPAQAARRLKEFPVPTANSVPIGITTGPDGNLWFTEFDTNKIGKITTAGKVTEYPIPTASSFPLGITTGPDGNLWFTEQRGNKIGQITPSGAVTEYALPTANSQPAGIAPGPYRNVWFTEDHANKIGQFHIRRF